MHQNKKIMDYLESINLERPIDILKEPTPELTLWNEYYALRIKCWRSTYQNDISMIDEDLCFCIFPFNDQQVEVQIFK